MADAALAAAYKAIAIKFNAQAVSSYPDLAPPTATRPYYVFFWMGGGQRRYRQSKHDANLVMGIKCVAKTMAEAMVGAANVTLWFDDQGVQDVGAGSALNAGPNWAVLATRQESVIHLVEDMDKPVQVYHEGWQIRFWLEEV